MQASRRQLPNRGHYSAPAYQAPPAPPAVGSPSAWSCLHAAPAWHLPLAVLLLPYRPPAALAPPATVETARAAVPALHCKCMQGAAREHAGLRNQVTWVSAQPVPDLCRLMSAAQVQRLRRQAATGGDGSGGSSRPDARVLLDCGWSKT